MLRYLTWITSINIQSKIKVKSDLNPPIIEYFINDLLSFIIFKSLKHYLSSYIFIVLDTLLNQAYIPIIIATPITIYIIRFILITSTRFTY